MKTFDGERKRFWKWVNNLDFDPSDSEESSMFTAWLAGQELETACCLNCKKQFLRSISASRKKTHCDAERCQKIMKIKNAIAPYTNLPHTCSKYRFDIDYHGSPRD